MYWAIKQRHFQASGYVVGNANKQTHQIKKKRENILECKLIRNFVNTRYLGHNPTNSKWLKKTFWKIKGDGKNSNLVAAVSGALLSDCTIKILLLLISCQLDEHLLNTHSCGCCRSFLFLIHFLQFSTVNVQSTGLIIGKTFNVNILSFLVVVVNGNDWFFLIKSVIDTRSWRSESVEFLLYLLGQVLKWNNLNIDTKKRKINNQVILKGQEKY